MSVIQEKLDTLKSIDMTSNLTAPTPETTFVNSSLYY